MSTFQAVAPRVPDPTTATALDGATVTIPATVLATAVPTRSAPSRLKTAERPTAGPGLAPRVATRVAIAFPASWKPFVTEKASANPIASQNAIPESSTPIVESPQLVQCFPRWHESPAG